MPKRFSKNTRGESGIGRRGKPPSGVFINSNKKGMVYGGKKGRNQK